MAASGIQSASNIQMDYMKLLVTQLQNQNPLEPMDNQEMASQLAQFSQLQQLETMNSSFAQVLETAERSHVIAERSYANSLLGKKVTFYIEDELTGLLDKVVGNVDSVFNDIESGRSLLGVSVNAGEEIEEYTLGLDAVVLVEEQGTI